MPPKVLSQQLLGVVFHHHTPTIFTQHRVAFALEDANQDANLHGRRDRNPRTDFGEQEVQVPDHRLPASLKQLIGKSIRTRISSTGGFGDQHPKVVETRLQIRGRGLARPIGTRTPRNLFNLSLQEQTKMFLPPDGGTRRGKGPGAIPEKNASQGGGLEFL
jgi:hypothetical protein